MRPAEAPSNSVVDGRTWPVVAAFVLGVLLLLAAARIAFQRPAPDGGAQERSDAAYARITHLAAVLVAATNAETCSHGYIVSGDPGFLAPYERALAVQVEVMTALEAMYAGDVERGQMLRDIRDALATQREHMSRNLSLRQALGTADAALLIERFRGRELTDSVRTAINVMVIEEQSALARARVRVASASADARTLLVSGGISVVFLSLGLTGFVRSRRVASASDVAA